MAEKEDIAIRVQDVSKLYKLYDSNKDRFVEALGLSRHKKLYHEHYALRHLSFDVKRGECVGIIGTNGAGKSTILKIITGVLSPTEGNVIIDGRISALLELGAGFNMDYSGIENVYLNGMMMGYSRDEIKAKMKDILDFADIGEFVYQPVKTYSSGMFVRLAFAVAINIDPEILIVDEALSVGDIFFQAKCYQKFEEFKKEGKTILFVSHDLGSVAKYCDRVVLLNRGEKLAEGSPRKMIDLYKKILTSTEENQEAIIADVKSENTEGTDKGDGEENAADYARQDTPESLEARPSDTDWKSHYHINPHVNAYGSEDAEIIDFAVIDSNGQFTDSIIKGTKFTIKSKVKFNKDIKEPIFTYTFKTVRGVDVTGTNTRLENKTIPLAKAGDVYVASFTQEMNLQGGEYLLSISCTGFVNGVLQAYNRLYDLLNISVISEKNTVGFYDMNSEVTVEKIK